MVKVYGVKLLDDLRFLEMRGLFHACLPKEVCNAASEFKFIAGKQRKVLGEMLLRALIFRDHGIPSANLVIDTTAKGKPFLASHPHIHFNISHSGKWVVIAFSSADVGVDVEKVRDVNLGIAQRFFSEKEKQYLFSLPAKKQMDLFFDLWTLKESFLKAIGTGLTKPLKSFTIQQAEGAFCLSENADYSEVFFKQIKIERNYKLSVCSFENEISDDFTAFYTNDLVEMMNF